MKYNLLQIWWMEFEWVSGMGILVGFEHPRIYDFLPFHGIEYV